MYPVLSPVEPGEVRAQLPPHPPDMASRWTRSSPTWIGSSCRASRTGSRRTSSPTSLRTARGRRSSATWCRPASACRGCCGRPARPAPSSRRTCWTGWSSCSICPSASAPTGAGGGVIQDSASARRCARSARGARPGPRWGPTRGRWAQRSSPTPPRRRTRRSRRASASPGSADTCARSTSTLPSRCARIAGAPSTPTSQAGRQPFFVSRPSVPRPRTPSTRLPAIAGAAAKHGAVAARRRGDGRHRRALPRAPLVNDG